MRSTKPNWFKDWFNQDYADLYSKRDAKEAEYQVSFLLQLEEVIKLNQDLLVLDVACGTGRHLAAFLKQNKLAFGVDLSKALLQNTPKAISGRLLIGDMRYLPVATDSLNLVTSFFTSFGYFSDAVDENRVLAEFNRVLAKNGLVFFDLANKQFVADRLVKEETIKYQQGTAQIQRSICQRDGQTRVVKTIELKKNDGQVAFHTEDVHLFDAEELSILLKATGFNPLRTFGGFKGEEYSLSSQRLVVLAEKV